MSKPLPTDAEILAVRARLLAAPLAPSLPKTEGRAAIVARAGDDRYAFAADSVREVGRLDACTPVPGAPAWCKGLANWRGEILAVIDLSLLLGGPRCGDGPHARCVVLGEDLPDLGIAVDAVEGLMPLPPAGSLTPFAGRAPRRRACVAGVTPDHVTVCDVRRLLDDPQLFFDLGDSML